jgi:hypothetical protein
MGLRNGAIPTSDLSVSSQKSSNETVDSIRLGNSRIWVAARNDSSPSIEIRFSPGKNFSKSKFYFCKKNSAFL